jgi:Caspase domain
MTRKALVVGIQYYPNFYGKGRPHNLQNPPRDAEKIAQLLEKYGRFEVTRLPVTVTEGGYQVNEVGVVNARTLRDAIYELFVEPRDGKLPQTALLFFAGHGLSRSEYGEMVGYLGTSDNNPEREKWGVEFSWIAKQLIKSQVPEQVIWLDCCHIAILNDFLYISILMNFGKIKFMFLSKKLEQKFDNLKRPA